MNSVLKLGEVHEDAGHEGGVGPVSPGSRGLPISYQNCSHHVGYFGCKLQEGI